MKFCIEMLIYADQHFTCDGDASKCVEVARSSLGIRDKVPARFQWFNLILLLHRILPELQDVVQPPSIKSPMQATIKMKVFMFFFYSEQKKLILYC